MTYKAKAMIPLEIKFPTQRTNSFTPSNNDGLLEKSLDLIEERRENVISIGVLSIQVQAKVRRQHEVKAISAWRLGIKKSFGYYKEPSMGKVRAQLGRAISYHLGG